MELHSLGRRTDFIFAKQSGTVTDKGSYTVIRTPSNPTFHWGNYIVFDHSPQVGSLQAWTKIFDEEFADQYTKPHHYVFTWDTGKNEAGDCQEFLDSNFEVDSAVVLVARNLKPPPYLNSEIHVRAILSDQDWTAAVRLQVLCADPEFLDESYEQFKQRQMSDYRKMTDAGMGAWFGAFIGNRLVGDLGIFFEGSIGRFQNVGTHPEKRRQGICGALVYQSGLLALKEFGIDQLVMEADVDGQAVRIYESVGFMKSEVNYALSWWKGKKQSV